MATSTSETSTGRFSPEQLLVGLAITLMLLPWLFVSSPDYREVTLTLFGFGAVSLGFFIQEVRKAAGKIQLRAAAACISLVYLASLAGGLRRGETIFQALGFAACGAAGVAGMAVLTLVLLQAQWRRAVVGTFLGLTIMLLCASLMGFFVFTEWHLQVSLDTPYMEPRRLALIWPTRLIAGELGNEFWAHTNTAAFLFAIAWTLIVEQLTRPRTLAVAGWILAIFLGGAVFLTASRSAWLMIILVLPGLCLFRSWRFSAKVLAALAASLALGYWGMKHKISEMEKNLPPQASSSTGADPGAIHVSGLVERGSAGRSVYYKHLWADLEGGRLFGHGHAVARTPQAHLLHEHSTYLATLRSGGAVALAGHLMLMGLALSAAARLAASGCRWPLLLGVAVFSGLLFDRSTVFRLTGFDEFPTHWVAVWLPLLLSHRIRSQRFE